MSYTNNWLNSLSEAYKSKAKKKAYVEEDTETLLAIIEVLCEELNIDMNVLMEQTQMTRKDFVNWGRAEGWNKPAPAAAPHGSLAANARDVLIAAARARGTRSQRLAAAARADAIPAGKETALKIELEGPIQDVSEPSAAERAAGAPGAVIDPKQFDRTQGSIGKITDRVGRVEDQRKLIRDLQQFAIGGNKPKNEPKKGKGKK